MKKLTILIFSSVLLLCVFSCKDSKKKGRSDKDEKSPDNITVKLDNYKHIRDVDERFQSYNIEMASVVGGDFWKPYKDMDTLPKDRDYGGGLHDSDEIYQTLPPIDLSSEKLRTLAKGLAPAFVRVSGTWANAAYFQDNDKPKMEEAPDGFVNVLSRDEWKGVLDFMDATDSKLVTSFAVSNGVRDEDGVWTPREVKKLVKYTEDQGGKIYAAEPFNEPNMPSAGGEMPDDFGAEDYAKDIKAFNEWAEGTIPDMKTQGPGSVGEGVPNVDFKESMGADALATDELMSAEPHPKFDIFSFHYYGAVSQRLGDTGNWSITAEESLSKEWLSRIDSAVMYNVKLRDKYLSDAPIWNTETAQAAGGGEPWAADYIDTFRYLYELGTEAKLGVDVNMHNTLESSEYSLVTRDDFTPKPNYWAALLWAKFMGSKVYDAESDQDGVYLFVHNLEGSDNGKTLLVINTNEDAVNLDIPADAQQYTLTSDDIRSQDAQLNSKGLQLTDDDDLPEIEGDSVEAGQIELPKLSSTFLSFK